MFLPVLVTADCANGSSIFFATRLLNVCSHVCAHTVYASFSHTRTMHPIRRTVQSAMQSALWG